MRIHYGASLETSLLAGNAIVRSALLDGNPHAIGKIGSLEAEALAGYLRRPACDGKTWPPILRQQLFDNVGIFPADADAIGQFCRLYLASVPEIDVLVVWGNPGEAEILRQHAVPRRLIRLDVMEPWGYDDPWSSALAGKRVVVVSPFADSIERQFARREQIWTNPDSLPPCRLRTVRMPLSPGLVPSRYASWWDQFCAVRDEVDREPYDVLLVGAGGISLPLAAHARRNGRVGIHMGGTVQVLFGIIGKRYEASRSLAGRRGTAWTRPSGAESPSTVIKVEQGCYW